MRLSFHARIAALLLPAALLAGCAASGPMAGSRAEIGGQSWLVSPLTASTWTVSSPAGRTRLPRDAAANAAQLQAIENASGCKVTDSNYSDDGLQLDAQVACPGMRN